MANNQNIVNLNSHRERRARTELVLPGEMANTGSKPFLARASDDKIYWCKKLHSPHGREAIINEVVASIVGQTVSAPIRPWKIIHVPDELSQTLIENPKNPTDRYRIGDTPLFGSLNLHTAEVTTSPPVIPYVNDNGNINRIPQIIALWDLCCMREDHQLLIDFGADNELWSIDHGFWFDSLPQPWNLAPPETKGAAPKLPLLRTPIPYSCWDKAIRAVSSLDTTLYGIVYEQMPDEWHVSKDEVDALVRYVLTRKPFTVSILEDYRATLGRE